MTEDKTVREVVLKEVTKCRSCRFCVDVCPTFQASEGVESMSAYGRIQILRYLLDGALEFDDAFAYLFYSCLQCKRCEEVCREKGQDVDICNAIRLGRRMLAGGLLHKS